MFAELPAQPDAVERVYYPVDNTTEPIIIIEQDKEQANVQAMFFNKHDTPPTAEKGNLCYMVQSDATTLIGNMLTARLNELRQAANPPFIYAYAYDGSFFVAKTKDALTGIVVCKEDDIEGGIGTLVREIERARKFGFTTTEYNRARTEYLRNLESAFNERDKAKNESYVGVYVRHFLDNEPIPGIENEYAIISQIAPNIPVEALNQMMQALVSDSNHVLAVFAPDKEGLVLPTKTSLSELIVNIDNEELTPYVDSVSDAPLMLAKPQGVTIVSQQ